MKTFPWQCPYCNRHATITESNYSENIHYFEHGNKDEHSGLVTSITVCPNIKCKEYVISATLKDAHYNGGLQYIENYTRLEWTLKPNSLAKQFPDYIPNAIIEDYQEACTIKDLSPKASATLSRRCLQGMISDFFKINQTNLSKAINAIKDEVDPTTWKAIDAVRKIGNIGAHMEKDINSIIPVEPNEAQKLIELIEMLIQDWYIARHKREENLNSITRIAETKTEQKTTNSNNATDNQKTTN